MYTQQYILVMLTVCSQAVNKPVCRITLMCECFIPNINLKNYQQLWAGHVALMGEKVVYRVLVWKPEGRRPLWRPSRRWVDNIIMYVQEVGCGNMDWIGLAQNRDRWCALVSVVMNLRVP